MGKSACTFKISSRALSFKWIATRQHPVFAESAQTQSSALQLEQHRHEHLTKEKVSIQPTECVAITF